jgi:hypothetical protein
MDTTDTNDTAAAAGSSRSPRLARLALFGMLLFGLVACAIDAARVPVQDWWAKRGPVVPHDSFPADCSLCHTGSDWHTLRDDFEFDHAALTGVPLVGAHARAECLRCHNDRGPVQVFAAKGCAGCHENVHRGQLGDGCADCHTEEDWQPKEQIAQHARTGFPLVGAHAATACWRCHSAADEGVFTGLSSDCATCHAAEALAATSPNHVAQGWTDGCERCHVPTAWDGAAFVHSGFPLTGAHAAADCALCHTGGVFAGTPSDCADCHLAEYQAATNPVHASGSFPTTCQSCHSTAGWQPATFSHTSWPLTGAHVAADCAQCHVGGVFAGTPTNCVDCHLADYQGTSAPNHAVSGFPTSCDTCHTTSAWSRADFDHDFFPIDAGDHAGLDCADCHLVPSNFGSFSCTHCHEHRQSEMDDEHDDVSGYVWSSPACLQCHPDGKD